MRGVIYLKNPKDVELGQITSILANHGYSVTVSKHGTVKTRLDIFKNEEDASDEQEQHCCRKVEHALCSDTDPSTEA